MAAVRVPILLGPTAVGKTATALALAERLDLEIVSADSRQVYRKLDIGTAKPSRRELRRVPHHGIDLIDPGQRFSAGKFAALAEGWTADIARRGRLPVVVGGTGLYVRALVDGLFLEPPLDPGKRRALAEWIDQLGTNALVRWAARLDPGFGGGGRQRAGRAIEVALLSGRPLTYWQVQARSRGSIDPWYVVLTVPRPVLHRRIMARAELMVHRGLIEEVASVLADGVAADAPGLDGVGVREAVDYLMGRRPRESVAEAIATSTRQYAKRQETWFRHQLGRPPLLLDATRDAGALADDIVREWTRTKGD